MSVHDETWDRPTCEFCQKEIPYGESLKHRNGTCVYKDPPRFTRGDNKRFHYRIYGSEKGQRYEIYTVGLNQWAECLNEEAAKIICEALEKYYE